MANRNKNSKFKTGQTKIIPTDQHFQTPNAIVEVDGNILDVRVLPEGSIVERYRTLDSARFAELQRARTCASLTNPEVLPPMGWTEEIQLPMPYSSTSGMGVQALSSRMLSALLPLNDSPFFSFGLKDGSEPEPEADNYLDTLAYQVYNKLNSKNLRETAYQVLQHLIITGDCLLIMEDDMTFRTIRKDLFVCRRDVRGEVMEIIYMEFVANPANEPAGEDDYGSIHGNEYRKGYGTVFVRLAFSEMDNCWYVQKEHNKTIIEEGKYDVLPYACLRWSGIVGENYGRSHVELMMGDIQTLESYTQALIQGMAAGSSFWMCIDPSGITEMDDLAMASNGQWVAARQQDVFTISPATTMKPQLDATMKAVAEMRAEVGKGFLLNSAAIPTGDRVTATAVRAIGQELEQVLGGAFSAIARDMMVPLVERCLFLMIAEGEVDERLAQEFTPDGLLSVDIITGLQALSRDQDLTKLLQMGEMVRNLPEQAAANFRWDEYAKSLITALGFDSRNWVKSEEEVMEQQRQAEMQKIAATGAEQIGGAAAQAAGAAVANQVGENAEGLMDLMNTSGIQV